MNRLRTVALLARQPGLLVLRDALLADPAVDLVQVFTHDRLPKAEGGGERPECLEFEAVCARRGVPFRSLDWAACRNLERHLPEGPLDLMVALSWRTLVTKVALSRFRIGAINLHRGALPKYSGAEPVRRAIEAGETRVAITAHWMAEAIDAGGVIDTAWLDLDPSERAPADVDAAAERVKERLYPLYAPLARAAIATLARNSAA